MTKNKNPHFTGCLETCKKLGLRFGRVCGLCEKIKKPINRIISVKALPASPFASTNSYRSEQPPKNQAIARVIASNCESNCKL